MVAVVFKLVTLFLKQAAKPVSTYFKGRAKVSDGFKRACVNSAQWLHVLERRLVMATSGSGVRLHRVRPLDEKVAVETGAEILGEGLVLGITCAVTWLELARSAAEAAKKKERLEAAFQANSHRIALLHEGISAARQDTLTLMTSDQGFSAAEVAARVRAEQERLHSLAEHRPEHRHHLMERIAEWNERLQQSSSNALIQAAAGRLLSFLPRAAPPPSSPSSDPRS